MSNKKSKQDEQHDPFGHHSEQRLKLSMADVALILSESASRSVPHYGRKEARRIARRALDLPVTYAKGRKGAQRALYASA